MNEKDKKRRLYEITAYKEYFTDLMYKIQNTPNLRWYWCYHDKDTYDKDIIDDSGELKHKKDDIKEPHYHILVYFDNGRTISGLMKSFDFDKENKIKYWKKGTEEGRLDYRVRYLIHFKSKDPHKYEYSLEELHTNDEGIEKFFTDNDKKQYSDISLLFDFFDNEKGPVSYRGFLNYVYVNNLWGTYQRNAIIFNRLLDEHNNSIKGEFLELFK